MKPVYIMLQNEMIIKTMVDHKDTCSCPPCVRITINWKLLPTKRKFTFKSN